MIYLTERAVVRAPGPAPASWRRDERRGIDTARRRGSSHHDQPPPGAERPQRSGRGRHPRCRRRTRRGRRACRGGAHRSGRYVLGGHGPEGVPGGRGPLLSRPRPVRHHADPAPQAAGGRGRGLGPGRGIRAAARLRPGRGRGVGPVRPAGGHPRPGGRGRRGAAAGPADTPRPGPGAPAHRRSHKCRAGGRDRPGQPGHRRGPGPPGRHRTGQADRGQRPAGAGRHQADRRRRHRLACRPAMGPDGLAHRAGLRLAGRQGRGQGVRREARPGVAGEVTLPPRLGRPRPGPRRWRSQAPTAAPRHGTLLRTPAGKARRCRPWTRGG